MRATKFTPEVCGRILEATRLGATRRAAAAAGGVSESQLYHWVRDGRLDPASEYADFARAFDLADGEAELRLTAVFRRAAQTDWRAALEFLSRRFPYEWGREAKPYDEARFLSEDERARSLAEALRKFNARRHTEVHRTREALTPFSEPRQSRLPPEVTPS